MEQIKENVKTFSENQGYVYYSGPTEHMAYHNLSFPLLWQEPTKVLGRTGIEEGIYSYKVTVHLLDKPTTSYISGRDTLRSDLISKLIRLQSDLADQSKIASASIVSITANETPLTTAGDISATAEFKIEKIYSNLSI